MKPGDTVKLTLPANASEAKARFTLVEHNGDRCFIALICDWPFPPIETVRPSDIEPADDTRKA